MSVDISEKKREYLKGKFKEIEKKTGRKMILETCTRSLMILRRATFHN
jgi:hypothetical protein